MTDPTRPETPETATDILRELTRTRRVPEAKLSKYLARLSKAQWRDIAEHRNLGRAT